MNEGSARKVDTIAQFWLANQGNRLQRMQKWQFLHPTPYPELISKEVYHDLFEYLGLNEGIVQNYFLARAKRCHKEDAVAFDSSTVSSYSRYIPEFGRIWQIKSSLSFDCQRVESFFKLLSCVHARACL